MAGEVQAWEVLFKLRGPRPVPTQVSHLGSWILKNYALGFFTRLFFEVVEMKACKLWPLPTHRWRWQPTFSEEGGGPALGWGGVWVG